MPFIQIVFGINVFREDLRDRAGRGFQFNREADSIACGPDLDELAESVRPFIDAGFTDIAIVQVGDEQQQRFVDEIAAPLLEKLRAL